MQLKINKSYKIMICFAMVFLCTFMGRTSISATTLQYQGGTKDWINPAQNSKTITEGDFIGRYSLNYTGNVNYSTYWIVGTNQGEPGGYSKEYVYNDLNFPAYYNLSSYKRGETQYYTPDRYGASLISSFNSTQIKPNSSTAALTPSVDGAAIKYAYLIWYCRDSGNLFGYYNDPVCLYFPDGTNEWVTPEHACIDTRYGIDSYLCLSADVTEYVKNAGYGTYGVANIPYWYQTNGTEEGQTAGSTAGGWQLVIVEESENNPVRNVQINIGSTYAESKNGVYSYTGTLSLKNGLMTKPVDKSGGQVYFTGFASASQFSNGNRYYVNNTISSNTKPDIQTGQNIYSGLFINNNKTINSHVDNQLLFAMLESFDDIGNNATMITMNTQGFSGSWDSYCCLGMAIDLAFPSFDGQQKTTVNSDNSIVTVTGGYTNTTTYDTNTGIGGGALTVTLDDELTPKNSTLILTKDGNSTSISGTWNAATHTVTFNDVELLNRGDKCEYTIECSITSTDDERFTNKDALSGYLYSNGARITGIPIEKVSSSESYLYLIVEILLDPQGTAIDGGTIKSAGTSCYYEYYQVGNYADKMHKTPITKIEIPTKAGCQFMGYYTGKNGTGTQYIKADGTITSTATTFKDDTTLYAYWTPGVYAVIDADTNETLFYEKYTVGFFRNKVLNSNGVTYDAANQITAIATIPTKVGNIYSGYFTERDGKGTQYVLDTKDICMGNTWIIKDTKVYAKWTPQIYTITCDRQGGTAGIGSDRFYEQYSRCFMYNQIVLTTGTQTYTYNYTGGVQTFTAPYTGIYYLNVLGAQGSSAYATGGLGGRSYGCVNLVQGETLYIYVGGAGNGMNGGWNGGAAGSSFNDWWYVAGGGGGTDIRRSGTGIGNRIIVAGGGGSSAITYDGNNYNMQGGNGGGLEYQPVLIALANNGFYNLVWNNQNSDIKYYTPQLHTANGIGGGGGYYGGHTRNHMAALSAGEGGTGYVGGVASGVVGGVYYGTGSIAGQNTGNGLASIIRSNYTTQIAVTTKIDKPTRNGYTFMGYYTGVNGTGQQVVDARGNITVSTDYFSSNTTVYAYWIAGTVAIPDTYIVHFDGNGAISGSMSPMICTIGQTYQLHANAFIRENYTFTGWALTPTGGVTYSNTQWFNQSTFGLSTGGSITLYAVWKDAIPPNIIDNSPDDTSGLTVLRHTNDEIEYEWINTAVNLDFSATDNVGMSSIILYDSNNNILSRGIDKVKYTVTTEGITKYKVIATDTSGNTATLKVTVKIDYVAPSGTKSVDYDGYNLTVSIKNIIEKLSGCKKAWIVIKAYNAEGTIIQTDIKDLTIINPNQIHDGAEYNGIFALEDVYNYESDYMTVDFWIKDIAGNERKIGDTDTIDTFYLSGYVTRAKGAAEYWKAGEMGYVDVITGVYVDKIYITYPDVWTALDATLGTHIFDYIGVQVIEQTERDSFYIPIKASNAEYNITVIAEKNGHTKTVLLPVKTDGNIISDIRTRIRYSPDKYPIFKNEE